MLCQVYFSLKNLNVQSIVYQFYFNSEKRTDVKKIKRQTTGWKNMAKIFQVRDLDIE